MKTKNKASYKNKTHKLNPMHKLNKKRFYEDDPKITTIEGHKFLFLPVTGDIFNIKCRFYGGFYIENKENLGISHLLEHLILDSWYKCNGNCTRYLERYGLQTNAFTKMMSTGYWAKSLKNNWSIILKYMLQIIFNPEITEKSIEIEKHAIENELSNKLNDPNYKL